MADLRYFGFVLALAAYVQSWLDSAVELWTTGRGCIPGVAGKVVQSAEDVSVSVFLHFVGPIVPKAHKTATSVLEWADKKVDQGKGFMVEHYEGAKNTVTSFVAQLQEKHGERVESFVKAREGVSAVFRELSDALKEGGFRGGLGYVSDLLKKCQGPIVKAAATGAQKVAEFSVIATILRHWQDALNYVMNNPLRTKVKELFTTQLYPFLLACAAYLRNLLKATYATVMIALEAAWTFTREKANTVIDTVVASSKYAQAVDFLAEAISWVQGLAVVQKVSRVVAPYAMPVIEMIEGNQFLHDIVERMKPVKSD